MPDIEPTNLCKTCGKMPECFQKGIFERQTCDQYEDQPLGELAERDDFVRAILVGDCPRCGSENTYDCDSPLELISDPTVGYCLDCGAYWCLECGYVFEKMEKGMKCPHWGICEQCSGEHGYLTEDKFIDKVCPSCEHYDNGCQLEEPSNCEKVWQHKCPYEPNLWECPEIEEFLSEQP